MITAEPYCAHDLRDRIASGDRVDIDGHRHLDLRLRGVAVGRRLDQVEIALGITTFCVMSSD